MSLQEVEQSGYNEEKVMEYFLHLTRNLEGIGGMMPSMLSVKIMSELIEDGTPNKEAFEKALAQLKEFAPIDEDDLPDELPEAPPSQTSQTSQTPLSQTSQQSHDVSSDEMSTPTWEEFNRKYDEKYALYKLFPDVQCLTENAKAAKEWHEKLLRATGDDKLVAKRRRDYYAHEFIKYG